MSHTPDSPHPAAGAASFRVPTRAGAGTTVMAHRGASRAERENTLAAFVRAAEFGADAVELDVRRCRGGDLVVHHDPRLADGRVIVETSRLELPAEVPDLGAALDACRGMWVNVEIKNDPNEADFDATDDIAAYVARALRARGEDDRFLVSSFRRETIDRFRAEAPTIATAWLTPGVAAADCANVFAALRADGHAAVHPWFGLVTREFIDAAHRYGLMVNVWTCDDPDKMRELAGWGVDGICTNVPDEALEVLSRK